MSLMVAGSLHWDVIVSAPRLPRLDETLAGQGVRYAFGGKGGNQAVAAARMGARVAMAGRVGTDQAGQAMRAELARAGVDAGQVSTDPGSSGMSVAIVDAMGNYGAVIVSAANLTLDAAQVILPPGTTHLMLQSEIRPEANRALGRAARGQGARVIWNAAPIRAPDPVMLALSDILIVNRIEAADLLGRPDLPDPLAAATALAALGPAAVILTLGAGGLILHHGQPRHLPAHDVTPISTHGAGDAFAGALAAALDTGAALAAACTFAQAAAALHVATDPAARPGITASRARALAGL